MNMIDIVLAKNYANLISMGFQSVSITDNKINFVLKDGTTQVMTFPKPADGISVTEIYPNGDHIFAKYSDGRIEDIGQIIYSEMHIGTEPPTDDKISVWINPEGEQKPFVSPEEVQDIILNGTNEIPCTDINITQDELVFSIDDKNPVLLMAVPTPYDTTENVKWESSDLNVAYVNKCGAVIPTGVGTAYIKSICGSKTDTTQVTVNYKRLNNWKVRSGWALNTSAAKWESYTQDTRGYVYYDNSTEKAIPLDPNKQYRIKWDDITEEYDNLYCIRVNVLLFNEKNRVSSSGWTPISKSASSYTFNSEMANGMSFNIIVNRSSSDSDNANVATYENWLNSHIIIEEIG